MVQSFSALGHGTALTKIGKSKKECSRWVGEVLDLVSEDIQESTVHDEEQERRAEQRSKEATRTRWCWNFQALGDS